MDILAAIRRRVSVRSYAERSADPVLLERLLALSRATDHITEVPPRVDVISGVARTRQVLTYLIGSYGLVQNPPHLLVGVLPGESDVARIDLGYVLERVVLEATRVGLATCWVTGSYDAKRAGDVIGLALGEVAAAVCALGYAAEGTWGRLHSSFVRWIAGGHRRKPLTDIVFSERWGEAWVPESADPKLVAALEHARLAPSAANRQPWRFILRGSQVALALVRPAPIDAGIVMAHFALASAALGREGQWLLRLRDDTLARECDLPGNTIPIAVFT